MRICCWKPQFESMAQDFGDQAFRDCWLFPRTFFSSFFSFANHLISNIRCDKDNSGMPMFISPLAVSAPMHLRYFSKGSALGIDICPLIRCSLANLHAACTLAAAKLCSNINLASFNQNNTCIHFLEITSSTTLSIHLPGRGISR